MAQIIEDQLSNLRCESLMTQSNNQKTNHRSQTIGDLGRWGRRKTQVGMDVPVFGFTPLARVQQVYSLIVNMLWQHVSVFTPHNIKVNKQ